MTDDGDENGVAEGDGVSSGVCACLHRPAFDTAGRPMRLCGLKYAVIGRSTHMWKDEAT